MVSDDGRGRSGQTTASRGRAGSRVTGASGAVTGTGFVHDALFFASDEDLVAAAVPYLRAGLEAGERALLVCHPHREQVLNAALRDEAGAADAARVSVVPAADVYQRPAAAVAAYQEIMEQDSAAGGRGVRVVAELDYGAPGGWWEWSRAEAVVNHVLAAYPLTCLCVHDSRHLSPEVIAAAHRSHPNLVTADIRTMNDAYEKPRDFLRGPVPPADPMESHPPTVAVAEVGAAGLAGLRAQLRSAARAGSALADRVIDEYIQAISEVATNAILHGAAPVGTRLWVEPNQLLAAVTDRGRGFDDPLAGYLPPAGGVVNNLGLWLARRFSDLLTTEVTSTGFTVRLSVGVRERDQ
jgi:anti-sigma regulatory factor (Ser/Thr protein kinase)